MKQVVFTLLFLIATVPVITAAAGVIEEERSLLVQLKAYDAEYDALTAKRATFAKRNDDLRWTHEQLEKQIRAYNTDREDLNRRMNLQLGTIRDHDSRCGGTFDDQGYVDACNAEASRLDTITNAQNRENESLNHTRSLLKTAAETQVAETNKLATADQAAADRQNVIAKLAQPIVERLKALEKKNILCRKAIAAVDADPTNMLKKERMHDVCGEMFDGNK